MLCLYAESGFKRALHAFQAAETHLRDWSLSLLHPNRKHQDQNPQDDAKRILISDSGTSNPSDALKQEGLRQLHVVVHELHQLLPEETKQQALGTPQHQGSCASVTEIVSRAAPPGTSSSMTPAEEIMQSVVCLQHLTAGLEAAAAPSSKAEDRSAGMTPATETAHKAQKTGGPGPPDCTMLLALSG